MSPSPLPHFRLDTLPLQTIRAGFREGEEVRARARQWRCLTGVPSLLPNTRPKLASLSLSLLL